MSDDELIRIATTDAAGLTHQTQEIIRDEVAKRKLDNNVLKGVEAQNKSYSVQEIDKYCDIIQSLNCPTCQTSNTRLNATMTSDVVSAIIFSTKNRKIKVGCGACLDKANNNALTKSILLGWWGIPWGIF
jgi:mannose/fructose/N-acetylgalactosamine-specific phosphotransferase system component IIB